jgi:hypothetical protein
VHDDLHHDPRGPKRSFLGATAERGYIGDPVERRFDDDLSDCAPLHEDLDLASERPRTTGLRFPVLTTVLATLGAVGLLGVTTAASARDAWIGAPYSCRSAFTSAAWAVAPQASHGSRPAAGVPALHASLGDAIGRGGTTLVTLARRVETTLGTATDPVDVWVGGLRAPARPTASSRASAPDRPTPARPSVPVAPAEVEPDDAGLLAALPTLDSLEHTAAPLADPEDPGRDDGPDAQATEVEAIPDSPPPPDPEAPDPEAHDSDAHDDGPPTEPGDASEPDDAQ